jgi:hypothetical protein
MASFKGQHRLMHVYDAEEQDPSSYKKSAFQKLPAEFEDSYM